MLGNGPKSLKDFKKVNNTNTSNNPILQQKQMQKKGKGNINLTMMLNQDGNEQNGFSADIPKFENRGNSFPPLPLEEVLPQNALDQGQTNSFDNFSNVNGPEMFMQSTDMYGNQPMDTLQHGQEDFGVQSNFTSQQQYVPQQPIMEEEFPKPNFLTDDTDYHQMAKENMHETNASSNLVEEKGVSNMNYQNQNTYNNENFAPFTAPQNNPTNNVNRTVNSKSNIAKKVAEAEAEIDALVGNTEMFLENITNLKLQIINSRNMDELQNAMTNAYNTLNNIPMGFIDVETCRKIRVCFSHLEKTKKHLLETELGLLKLASIDDVNELEKTYMEVPASASTDTIYEVRTFELVLLNRLPEIKEQMMKEKVLLAYQQ